MSEHTPKTATSLLQAVSNGHPNAVNELLPLVYDELRHMAAAYLQTERPDHTLQPTALLHEAFLKLIDQRTAGWQDRGQFFGVAAKAMRRILVDHARTKRRAKREGNRKRIPLDTAVAYLEQQASDLLMLDEALDKLAIFDQRKARVVELRFFVGLSVDDTAQVLSVSRRTVEREWTLAKAWLKGEISGEKAHDA